MAVSESEDTPGSGAATSLPPLSNPHYITPTKSSRPRTSSRSSRGSRRSRRSVTPPCIDSSPPPVPSEKPDRVSKRFSRDIALDQTISVLDPRRFTPTLHANLVSEILGLRRDQEEKLKFIENLEASLHSSREDHESLQARFSEQSKESRSIKRQLALLEGGTSSALGELSRERDEAVDGINETKKRLEVVQKKVRSQEEDSRRTHEQWAKERDEWEEERRKYERQLHVADSRLKAILQEVANFQAAQANGHLNGQPNGHEAEPEDSNREHETASPRTMSITNSIRYSAAPTRANGNTLADELNLDDDDDDDDDDVEYYDTEPDGRQSVASIYQHGRKESRDSIISKTAPGAIRHRRDLSNDSQVRGSPVRGSPMRPGSVASLVYNRMFMNQSVMERIERSIREQDEAPPVAQAEYRDTGVQFSPPPSPKLTPVKPSTPQSTLKSEKLLEAEVTPLRGEWEANQSRKRVHLNKPTRTRSPTPTPHELPVEAKVMVSAGSQTMEPPSPPRRPEPELQVVSLPSVEVKPSAAKMVSSGVQTDAENSRRSWSLEPSIPSISIHPPTSRSATPQEQRLPQYTKDVGCQVSILASVPSKSSAVQTEEIRVDTRLDKLPAHLHPSTIQSRPVTPVPEVDALAAVEDGKSLVLAADVLPPRNPRRLTVRQSILDDLPPSPPVPPTPVDLETQDTYPGNNDNGPLSPDKVPIRRPPRISSLFAGFDGAASSDDDTADGSDSEFRTALSPPRTNRSGGHRQRESNATLSTLDSAPSVIKDTRNTVKTASSVVYSSFKLGDRDLVSCKPLTGKPQTARPGTMRKNALIQSGIATHQSGRQSLKTVEVRDPPFPIPARASSRNPPVDYSNQSDDLPSPTGLGDGYYWRGARAPYRRPSVRKSRSAAPVTRTQRRQQGSRSPPPMSPSTEAPESPRLPPLPTNDITTPRRDRGAPRYLSHHHHQPSTTTANTEHTNMGSIGSSQQSSNVVDAIAQTMVGEWMFKYVRRRKSFGMGDTKAEESSNDRHKRWVWLAPYERAILWSSKQPSSGSALMGKSGRKLTIQSVLDVKDNNPRPKGAAEIFDRSILILTPQRALKFTAVTMERHYLWLTALAFLAHSQQAVPEILASPSPSAPAPTSLLGVSKFEPNFGPPPVKMRKPIRDSIMLKKSKSPPQRVPVLPTEGNQLAEAFEFKPEAFPQSPSHQCDLTMDTAEPPFIPRFHERQQERIHERASQSALHGRKRSNTGGHIPPPLSFRGFSSPIRETGSTNNSVSGSSEGYTQGSSWAMSIANSQRTSEASSRPGNNFFEAIGTVRMEAFISPLAYPRFEENPDEHEELRYRARRRSKEARRRRSRSRHRDSFNSRTTRSTNDWYAGSRAETEEYFRDDPFKGF